jgi:hypothetical protein
MHITSPTHQAILTNSASKYSEIFHKASVSISAKPDIALRVPIDRDEIVRKIKAKNIYNEEKNALVNENKQKLMLEEQVKAEKKSKKDHEKDIMKQDIFKLEEKKRLDRKMREDQKREQAYQSKQHAEKVMDKENKKRYNTLSIKYETIKKRKEDGDRRRMKVSFESNSNGRAYSTQNFSRLRHLEELEQKDVEDRLQKYLNRMAKADEIKHSYISEKINNTHHHLEKVEQNLQRRHYDESNDFMKNTPQVRSLTQKYERTKRLKQDAVLRQEIVKQK